MNYTLSVLQDHYYDKKFGIDTSFGRFHAPTSYRRIERMFDYLTLSPRDVFVDLGCGKGRVLFCAARRGIEKVVGVELEESLVSIARSNMSRLGARRFSVEIIHQDAAAYRMQDATVVFLYNPFNDNTLDKVMRNLKESLTAYPRPIRILYHNPRYHGMLNALKWLRYEGEISKTDIFVWSTGVGS